MSLIQTHEGNVPICVYGDMPVLGYVASSLEAELIKEIPHQKEIDDAVATSAGRLVLAHELEASQLS
jgi:hypothetical protein